MKEDVDFPMNIVLSCSTLKEPVMLKFMHPDAAMRTKTKRAEHYENTPIQIY